MGAGSTTRRHIPPALFLIALTLMIVAIARPAAMVTLPSRRATVILAMDVSGSMRATDVKPNRLIAAQRAAKAFIKDQPDYVRIGIVAFSGTAFLVQAPTGSRQELTDAIDRLELERATAVGSGLLVSLQALFPNEKIDTGRSRWHSERGFRGYGGYYRGYGYGSGAGPDSQSQGAPLGKRRTKSRAPRADHEGAAGLLQIGRDHSPDRWGDHDRTRSGRGRPRRRRPWRARVHGGLRFAQGQVVGFGGRFMRARLDEDTLKQIADITRGQYFHATTAEDLTKIYRTLNTQLVTETRKTEITAFFAAAAAAFALLSALCHVVVQSGVVSRRRCTPAPPHRARRITLLRSRAPQERATVARPSPFFFSAGRQGGPGRRSAICATIRPCGQGAGAAGAPAARGKRKPQGGSDGSSAGGVRPRPGVRDRQDYQASAPAGAGRGGRGRVRARRAWRRRDRRRDRASRRPSSITFRIRWPTTARRATSTRR